MKIRNTFALMMLSGGLFFTACEQQTETKNTENTTTSDTASTHSEAVSNEVEDVYDAYENLKDALVKDDSSAAKEATTEMKTQLDNFKADKMTPAEIEGWNTEAKKLREHLDKIQAGKDIEEMRTHFSPLSDAMYATIKKYNIADETIYYQHCPMAFDNKGASWLSEEEEISNPYLPETMLRCGETKETIEVKK